MSLAELYIGLAGLQGEAADLCFHVKGSLLPVEMPEKARDELSSQNEYGKGLDVIAYGQAELFSA